MRPRGNVVFSYRNVSAEVIRFKLTIPKMPTAAQTKATARNPRISFIPNFVLFLLVIPLGSPQMYGRSRVSVS